MQQHIIKVLGMSIKGRAYRAMGKLILCAASQALVVIVANVAEVSRAKAEENRH